MAVSPTCCQIWPTRENWRPARPSQEHGVGWLELRGTLGGPSGARLKLARAVCTIVLAQVVSVLGWGAWFSWAVPALLPGPRAGY
jgi:hypothetical protein